MPHPSLIRPILAAAVLATLGACEQAGSGSAGGALAARPPAPAATASAGDGRLAVSGMMPAQLDGSTAAEKSAAADARGIKGGKLGSTVASLGDATKGGYWLRTPLVTSPAKGRVVDPATGKSANVDLIPLGGPASGGSQISLPAMQMIGASLTDLPKVDVFRR